MDSKRFDDWTRNRALRLSRRDALRLVGVGGVAAALPALEAHAAAQETCSLTIHAETVGGPSASTVHDGTLQFTLGADGTFDQVSFTPSTGGDQSAVGRGAGRAIDFVVTLGGNQKLAFSGTGDRPIASCSGAAAGIFSGPLPGDIGGWQTTASDEPPSSSCPIGSELCGGSCLPGCPGRQPRDPASCACPPLDPACVANQQTCQNHDQCCSGFCSTGACLDCAGIVCGAAGCVDPTSDAQNCGGCGAVCDSTCVNGVCACLEDGTPCEFTDQCCSNQCAFIGICGCVELGQPCGATGDCCGNATDGQLCVNGVCVFPTGHACTDGTQCFDGTCTNGICGCRADGSPCEFSDQCCSDQCGFNGFCGCVQLGQSCGATGDCCGSGDGQLCVNGICVFSNGHSCTNGTQCFGGTCTNGVCA